ncbi:MAG: hypothetical protein HN745_13360 [Deltaproteobacteria bacterium]|nr:hypothetical protein [Deltaproteobacteria bacterium]
MTKLVNLNQFRMNQTSARGFASWRKRFNEPLYHHTRFSDLENSTIHILAQPGENSSLIFYELIMDILNLGNVNKFSFLKPVDRLQVIDIHLFLADLVRFEMMHRIEWIVSYTDCDQSLIELVPRHDASDYSRYSNPPQLSESHPLFASFTEKIPREKEVMIRQLFGDALNVFKTTFCL